jgi:hypothetical protein
MVESAAEESALALVGETLGRAPRRAPFAAPSAPHVSAAAAAVTQAEPNSDDERYFVPEFEEAAAMPVPRVPRKASRNGHTPDPKG